MSATSCCASQQAGRDAVARRRRRAPSVDRACRDVIADAGWGDAFSHGTGHGVASRSTRPRGSPSTAADTSLAGHVVTVEPGVYLPGIGGVRIEDTVVVTADGCRRPHPTPRRIWSRDSVSISTNDLKNGMALEPARGARDRRRVPAREAGQGRRVRAHQAEERRAPAR